MQDLSSDQTPDAYKNGSINFYGLEFLVTKDVLIPRPETEMLIAEVKIFLEKNSLTTPKIIDIGTGSGCLAITIAKLYPTSRVTAVDLSPKALEVARRNAQKHEVNNITFLVNDLLTNLNENFDILVTNLPYIPHSRLKELDPSVIDFEPVLALDGGSDGFDLYRKLFMQVAKLPILPRLIACEIDDTHGDIAVFEAKKFFPSGKISLKKDFANLDRILVVLN